MSVSGPKAMRALDDALRDIRREEDEITKRIGRSNERFGKLRETEVGQLRALAAIRLDADVQAQMSGVLGRAEQSARDMLKSHANAMAAMEKDLEETETRLTKLTRERQDLLERANEAQAGIDSLAGKVEAVLADDAEYGAVRAQLEETQHVAMEAARKAEQAEADREEKGRPYREDPLFIYLWERGYGTPNYKAGNVTRMLDNWVARLVGFYDARPNYAMLTAIPERLRAHADRLEEDVAALEADLDTREVSALDAAGGKDARQALEAAHDSLAKLDADIVAAEDERDVLTAEQKHLADGGDPAFGEAVGTLAEAIGETAIETLLADAKATGTPDDDAIVARLQETRRRIAEEQSELEDERARLRTLETRRRELEDIEFEFKKSRYDDPRSRFGQDRLIGDLLTEFLKGSVSASTYWEQWHDSHSWTGGPPRSSGTRNKGGFTFPPGSFSPRPPSGGNWGSFSRPRKSGGFGGGGFKTGGGFKGGKGFKTGGGF